MPDQWDDDQWDDMAKQIPLRGCACPDAEPGTCYEHLRIAAALRQAVAETAAERTEFFRKVLDRNNDVLNAAAVKAVAEAWEAAASHLNCYSNNNPQDPEDELREVAQALVAQFRAKAAAIKGGQP